MSRKKRGSGGKRRAAPTLAGNGVQTTAGSMSPRIQVRVAYYKEQHKAYMEGLDGNVFHPWNVEFNRGSRLLEFDLFRKQHEELGKENGLYYGVYSWKFLSKTGMKQDYIVEQLRKFAAMDVDVILLNPAIALNALFANGVEHGAIHHTHLVYIFERLGFERQVRSLLPHFTFTMSSYVVAKNTFWRGYIAFVEEVLSRAEQRCEWDAEFREKYRGSANYAPNMELDYRPFVVERLMQMFLCERGVGVGYIEPDTECFQRKFVENSEIVQRWYRRRCELDRNHENADVAGWLEFRKALFDDNPDLVDLVCNQDMFFNALHDV